MTRQTVPWRRPYVPGGGPGRGRALGPDAVYELHREGYLQGAFLQLASLNNFGRLVERKQRRKARQAAMTS